MNKEELMALAYNMELKECHKAAAALREYAATMGAKPVAWHLWGGPKNGAPISTYGYFGSQWEIGNAQELHESWEWKAVPLYAHPPKAEPLLEPKRTLTDADIRRIQAEYPTENDPMPFARALIAAQEKKHER